MTAQHVEATVTGHPSEGQKLIEFGTLHHRLGQYSEALQYFEQALARFRDIGDRQGEVNALFNLGVVYDSLGQYPQALDHFQQALAIARDIGDHQGEGVTLGNLGIVHRNLGQYPQALDHHQQALAIARDISDRHGESAALNELGNIYLNLGKYPQALNHHEQALAIAHDIGDRRGESTVFGNLGVVYGSLSQYPQALDYQQQALAIARDIGDRHGERVSLNSLGNVYRNLGQYPQALDHHQQAFAIARDIGDRRGESASLNNLGNVYSNLGQYPQALDHFQQALAIARDIGDRHGEGVTLGNLGIVYRNLGQYPQALDHYQQALIIQMKVNAPESLWRIWLGIAASLSHQNQPDAAIFAGKRAVNIIQSLRKHLQPLDQTFQDSFLTDKEDVYRNLADLLIAQGRLPEAQQVLDMLKEDELFDFIRRDSANDPRTTRASLTPVEQSFSQRLNTVSAPLIALGTEYHALNKQRRILDPAGQARLKELEALLTVARRDFLDTLDTLEATFARSDAERAMDYGQLNLESARALQSTLRDLGPGTVLVHTLMTDDTLHLLLTTPHVQLARQSPIGNTDLNRLINDFRTAIEQRSPDARRLGQNLYQHLIAPIAADLDQADTQTLMISLDSTLRYLPLAALYDGERYLAEHYALAIFTPVAQANLKEPPQPEWQVAGLGMSQGTERFSPLPAVPGELEGIVRAGPDDPDGVLDGSRWLDPDFTRDTFLDALAAGYPVLHIATHFDFQPGNDQDSGLLLGDGSLLTLADIREGYGFDFSTVDLITLSACNTALGGEANGVEIEGLGTLAQLQGAKGVIATLWAVADKSTGKLMQELYALRQGDGTPISKAEALRQAQLAFIRGEITPATDGDKRGEIINLVTGETVSRDAPPAAPDYRHPYYWAPFILMGNWL